jgi:thiamine biosynthesis lipoprotein
VQVASPFDESILHTFELSAGAAATSGIGRRSWLDAQGQPAHHLLDPASGRPAFTGIVQVTAIAPTAVEAEVLTKTTLLRGPGASAGLSRHGGVVVYDDGRVEICSSSPAAVAAPDAG